MKLLDIEAAFGAAILLLSLPCDAKHSHRLQHLEVMGKRHEHNKLHASPRAGGLKAPVVEKRGICEFPSGAGLVAVTPGSSNGGWAMSPDQSCTAGGYCPYACPPGQVMAQWNPQATSYTYPLSMVRLGNPHHDCITDINRTVDVIATRMGKSASPSLIRSTAWMVLGP